MTLFYNQHLFAILCCYFLNLLMLDPGNLRNLFERLIVSLLRKSFLIRNSLEKVCSVVALSFFKTWFAQITLPISTYNLSIYVKV